MTLRRSATTHFVTLVLLPLLAQALVPRATWYAHRHAGGGHEHVHDWDGTRVGRSTASLRDFLPHAHDDAGADAPRGHGDAAHGHGPDAAVAHDHEHAAAHSTVAGSQHSHHAAGPGLATAHDGTHAHAQAPFQTAVANGLSCLAPPRPYAALAAPALASLSDAPSRAARARGPPSSV